MAFKMLLLSYLYNLSERQTEEFANDSVAARYFLGLGGHQSAPDHSTLTVSKRRIIAREGPTAFEERLQRIVRLAKEKGISFGQIQVVDATHSIADVDVKKDDERRDGGAGPRDEDAAWGTKGRKRVRTTDGKTVIVNKSFYGYKAHLSLNAESGIITSVVVTPGNKPDGQQFPELVQKDEQVGIETKVYAGDKAYDESPAATELLRAGGKHSALCLNNYRTKLYPEGLWVEIKASEEYRAGQKERYKIEQKNAVEDSTLARGQAAPRVSPLSVSGLGEVRGTESDDGDNDESKADGAITVRGRVPARGERFAQGISMPKREKEAKR